MKTIDAQTLKRLLVSGANHLYNHYHEVDALNVFPVPDGDTGINMSLTCASGAQELLSLKDDASPYEVAKTFSHGLLMGARGNSGVITSQIFRGFAQGLENANEDIDVITFINAFKEGSITAYKAVIKPVEGTILTVIRESSSYASSKIKSKDSIEKALELLLFEAKESLKRTPELLPILKEVGVVDSGGTGLCYIIEGMLLAINGEDVKKNETANQANVMRHAAAALESEEFGYCTEFIMSLGPDSVKKPFDQPSFTKWLEKHGNSLVVVRDEEIIKVHVHTLTPGEILNFAQQYGEFLKLKIENMTEQHHNLENGAEVEVHTDLVEEEDNTPTEEYAIIAVSSGEGIDEYFYEVGASYIVGGGQTMNPSSEDFVAAIKATKARKVFILPNNSNILMAASQAADMFTDDEIEAFVIPSKTIPQGITSCLAFDPDESVENNFKNMKNALSNVKSGEITFAIRDCEINGVNIHKGDFIGIYEKDIVCGTSDKYECLMSLLSQMIDEESALLTIILGEDVSREEFFPIKKQIQELYPDVNIELRDGKQPVYSFLIGIE